MDEEYALHTRSQMPDHMNEKFSQLYQDYKQNELSHLNSKELKIVFRRLAHAVKLAKWKISTGREVDKYEEDL